MFTSVLDLHHSSRNPRKILLFSVPFLVLYFLIGFILSGVGNDGTSTNVILLKKSKISSPYLVCIVLSPSMCANKFVPLYRLQMQLKRRTNYITRLHHLREKLPRRPMGSDLQEPHWSLSELLNFALLNRRATPEQLVLVFAIFLLL